MSREQQEPAERFTLANRRHLSLFVSLLHLSGALCDQCGHGTRYSSKGWRKCQQCGARVRSRNLDNINLGLLRALSVWPAFGVAVSDPLSRPRER